MSQSLVYGPVQSKRYGLSMGVDVVPVKVCTLDCVYCQVGATTRKTLERQRFVEPDAVVEAVAAALARGPKPDIITFAGSGEPTLYSELGVVARKLRLVTDVSLLLITNGTLLWRQDVAAEAALFDRIAPSLDAGDLETFRRVNQPHPDLDLPTMVRGLRRFVENNRSKVDLEVLFVEGINDSPESLAALLNTVNSIGADHVDLNTAVRPTPHRVVRPVSAEFLNSVGARLQTSWRTAYGEGPNNAGGQPLRGQVLADSELEQHIMTTLARRPCHLGELVESSQQAESRVVSCLTRQLATGALVAEQRGAFTFYVPAQSSHTEDPFVV